MKNLCKMPMICSQLENNNLKNRKAVKFIAFLFFKITLDKATLKG